jgi:ribosomal protein L37E
VRFVAGPVHAIVIISALGGVLMSTEVDKAIGFECEKCGEYQFHEYALEPSWEHEPESRAVNADTIDCVKCGHPNRVYEEL